MADPYTAVVAGAVALAGAATVAVAVRRLRGWNPEADWTPRPAEILSSRVVDDGDTIRPCITYRWQDAGGGWHESDRITALSSWTDGAAYARQLVEQFPAGHKTTAYVHPANRAKSVLLTRPAARASSTAMLAAGVLLLIMSAMAFWAAVRAPQP